MSATERITALGSRSTISGWATISPFQKSSRFAHHRVHRRLDYPASLGLDQPIWEFVERGGSYAAPLALLMLRRYWVSIGNFRLADYSVSALRTAGWWSPGGRPRR